MEHVDIYCERLGPGIFAEPVNALTNIAFFVAAWVLWREAGRQGNRSPDITLLVVLIAAIGVGSSIFHTLALAWSRWLDVVPILLFQLTFLWLYPRRIMGWGTGSATALIVVYLAVALYGRQFPEVMNGSLAYAPAIAALLALGLYHWVTRQPAPYLLLFAAGVFTVSLIARTIDSTICPHFPLGTHFLWHLLNPVVLYLCVRAFYAAMNTNARRAP